MLTIAGIGAHDRRNTHWVRSFAWTAVTIAFHSVFIPMITVSRTTLIQRSAPEHLQGRMFALVQMAVIGMTAISTFATGLVAEWVPAPSIFLVAGLFAAATAFPGFFSRALRDDTSRPAATTDQLTQ